jgi:predicted component of type VI protein secretion system
MKDIEGLKSSLGRLHAELTGTVKVDPELKELLQALDQDINQLLNTTVYERPDADTLAERSQAISAKFAAGHPQLESILRELGAILERLGI